MTILEDAPTVVDEPTITEDRGKHLVCCHEDEFYCGMPYHPEMEADSENDDECCPVCVEMRDYLMCPFANHQHCALRPNDVICPRSI